ncbi:FUSC family protein [Corynebacterium halotolerans]|uniref:Integral membrane bound transporter domain-containing protein n=1 Tax=Corynebacterium halotolerans YIM 70093 = DSM 44683 TaxID=1121362 RepID=M1NQ66_9CORY|nr:FUSC family protein [Corynebacterium halotolerans]AGF73508.1 hypothetical protein A605_12560 [Corynebacterium halotolerans YIM 70093 = DSM 44683]
MAKLRIGTLERLKVVEGSMQSRARRVRKRIGPILQAAVAAGVAYWVAQDVFGHPVPFFAPIAVVIILSLSGGERIRRAVELSVGCSVGVGVGDLLFPLLGPGAWQIAVAVGVSLFLASFLSKSQLVTNQVAIGSILIATIMPPGTAGGGPERMFDAIIGSVIGLLTIALIPTSPLGQARQEVSKVLGIASSVLDDVATALEKGDARALDEALTAVRNSQNDINTMLAAAKTGRETSTLSPLLWGWRRRVRSLERILQPVDNAIRNVRVLARRALVLCEDGDQVSQRQINIIDELADITASLSDLYESHGEVNEATEIPELVRRLRVMGARADMGVVNDEAVLSEYVVLAQSRSIVSDLLQVCGMSRESSLAMLAPTSRHPAYPPEVWKELADEDDNRNEGGDEDRGRR